MGFDRKRELGGDSVACAGTDYSECDGKHTLAVVDVGDAAAALASLDGLGVIVTKPEGTGERRGSTSVGS